MDLPKCVVIRFVIFLSLFGTVLGQHMQCPAGDLILGSNITLRCYLPKAIYPAKCKTAFTDIVTFYKDGAGNVQCTLSSVSTSCSSSSSECSCESGNSTHYSLQHTFTVDPDDGGTWGCAVTCMDGLFSQLTYSSENCSDKNVSEPTPTTVAEATTSGPSPKPDCSLCQFSGCRDTGGCWGCIVLICVIVVITIACLCCWIFYCFCRHQCACCESCFSCLDSLFKSCCGIQGGQGNRPSPDGGDKPDPGATLESLPPHSNGTELTSTPGKPPEPSGKSPGRTA